jgi:hypothetical protein
MSDKENRQVADWQRVRSVLEHENTLVNHRVTWLLASQGFLFAGYFALINGWAKGDLKVRPDTLVTLVLALFAVSAYICLSIGMMLNAAIRHIKHIQCWWYKIDITAPAKDIEKASISSDLNHKYPYLQGWKARKGTRLLDTEFMPYFFLGGWIILVFIGIIVAYSAYWTEVLNEHTRILAILGALCVAVIIAAVGYSLQYLKRSPDAERSKR